MVALSAIVDRIEANAAAVGWGSDPVLMGFDREGVCLEVTVVDGTIPVFEALVGFAAPASWHALVLVAEGTARSLDRPPAALGEARVTVAVDRTGRQTSAVAFRQPPSPASQPVRAGEGRIIDACRRALGLATADPPSLAALWNVLWLDRVLRVAADIGGAACWPELAALHPSCGAQPLATSWHDLRTAQATLPVDCPSPDPRTASWMDDGMFAREVLGAMLEPAAVLVELEALLCPNVLDRVRLAAEP